MVEYFGGVLLLLSGKKLNFGMRHSDVNDSVNISDELGLVFSGLWILFVSVFLG